MTFVAPTKNKPVSCSMTVEVDHIADGKHRYTVVAVLNTLDYEPGEVMDDEEMASLVAEPDLDVIITQPRKRSDVMGG